MNDQITSTTADHRQTLSPLIDITVSDSNARATVTDSCPSSPPPDPLNYTGGPIPDSARKSYLQQKLPVRKQSLAAFGSGRRQKLPARRVGSSIHYPPPDRHTPSSTPLSTITPSITSRPPIRSANGTTSESPSSTSSRSSPDVSLKQANSSTSNNATGGLSSPTSHGDLENNLPNIRSPTTSSMITAPEEARSWKSDSMNNATGDEHDEDFDFGNRPPSTVDCTRPILYSTSSSNSSASTYMTTPLGPIKSSDVNSPQSIPNDTDTDPPLGTPSTISTQVVGLTNEDDDDLTVFSPSTPATYNSNDNDHNSGSDWPIIAPPLLSEINRNEGQEHVYQKNNNIGGKVSLIID